MSFDEYNSLSDEQLEAKMKDDILRTADVFFKLTIN